MRFRCLALVGMFLASLLPLTAQSSAPIKWHSMPEAEALQKILPKKVLVYIHYTECLRCGEEKNLNLPKGMSITDKDGNNVKPVYEVGCDFCQKMDKDTWTDPELSAYVTEHYYMVSLDASSQDTLRVRGKEFVSVGLDTSNNKKSMMSRIHQLAYALQEGKSYGYPLMVLMDEKLEILGRISGYRTVGSMMETLRYVAEDKHYEVPLNTYLLNKSASSQRYFAIRYYTGEEKRHYPTAKARLLRAEKQNPEDPLTMMWLALFYANGECGFEQDAEKSKKLYLQAIPQIKEMLSSEKEEKEVQFLWGISQMLGMGTNMDNQSGFSYLKKSADQNYVPALLICGDILDSQDDYDGAFPYYESAAKKSADHAFLQLARYYEKGKGINKDAEKAQYYYKLSCLGGEKEACDKMEKE